jgi:hypothetical protein
VCWNAWSPPPFTIGTLPVAMIESTLRTLLMPAIGAVQLLEPSLLAASPTAIALATITARAQKEQRAAFAAHANSQPEDHLAV